MFLFERFTERAIFVGGLTYELLSDDRLRVVVSVGHADGTVAITDPALAKGLALTTKMVVGLMLLVGT